MEEILAAWRTTHSIKSSSGRSRRTMTACLLTCQRDGRNTTTMRSCRRPRQSDDAWAIEVVHLITQRPFRSTHNTCNNLCHLRSTMPPTAQVPGEPLPSAAVSTPGRPEAAHLALARWCPFLVHACPQARVACSKTRQSWLRLLAQIDNSAPVLHRPQLATHRATTPRTTNL